MNLLIVLKILGVLLLCEAAALLPSVAVAVIYQEAAVYAFIKTIVIAAFLGFLLYSIKPQDKMIRYKEGFAIVSSAG